MGWVTLLLFPAPAFLALHLISDISLRDFLALDTITLPNITGGFVLGIAYAYIATWIMKHPLFDQLPLKVDDLVRSMKLNRWDALFLSICAGIGEELLFRAGIQYYLGPILTSILFVALHGYINLKNWKHSLYGFIVLPLSLIFAYSTIYVGLWFAISAHFMYDFVLFNMFLNEKK